MFADAIPMLEAADPIFSSKDTYKVMYYLENQLVPLLDKYKKSLDKPSADSQSAVEWATPVQRAFGNHKEMSTKQSLVEKISFMIHLLRCSCTRNLSRAMIIEK